MSFGASSSGTNIFNSGNQQASNNLFKPATGFGATNPTPAQPSGFGATSTGAFGAQQPAASGLGAFGNTQQSTFGQPANKGLFGQSTQQPTTSLFGQPATAGQNAFGQQPAMNAFGQTAQQPASTNAFGQTAQQPATGLNAFGQPSNQQTSTGLGGAFGQSTGTGGLFGNSTNQTTQPAAGGLFGNTATQQTGQQTNLFGQTTTGTGGLFGTLGSNNNNNNNNATLASNSLFASKPANSLFPTTQTQQQQKPSLFGQSNGLGNSTLNASALNPLGASALNQPSGSGLGASNLLASKGVVAQQADAQTQFAKLQEKIQAVANAWNPQSPDCRFQRCFYNLVDPSQVNMYGRPPNVTNESRWQKAVQENPDPSCLVPVFAMGFDDLRERVDAQAQQAAAHQEKLKDIQTRLAALQTRHTTSTTPRLARFSTAQTQLTLRLLALIQHLHLLIPSIRSSSIRPEEEELRKKLEELQEAIQGGGGRMRGKLGELWAILGAVKAKEGSKNASGRGNGGWKVVDEEGLSRITQVLADQQAGLAHLTKILQKDIKDLAIIMGTKPPGSNEEAAETDMMLTSTSSLRTSLR
ncbi:nucleoporin complex subunit 54-domain-containing protein [Mycena floridula]|nr:nucleoporin complex subunit 54-domain-containing protein [Mycena floridula]